MEDEGDRFKERFKEAPALYIFIFDLVMVGQVSGTAGLSLLRRESGAAASGASRGGENPATCPVVA